MSVGFIERKGDVYLMKSYQAVWRIMGVKQSMKKDGHLGFKYWKIVVDDKKKSALENDKEFLKNVKDGVFKHLVNRRKNQIAFRLALGRPLKNIRRKETIVELSGTVAAKMFGYKAWSSGLKHRDKYFKVFKGVRFSFLDHNGVLCSRYECSKVSLR